MHTPTRLTLIAGTAVAAVTLAGCGGSSGSANAGGEIESLTIQAPYLVTNAPQDGNEIETAVEEEIGVDLDINWAPNSSYEDRTNITLAGDDVPHVMVIQGKTPGFVKNAQAGAFWDLTDYLGDYENLDTTFPEVQESSSVNGQVFGIFRQRDLMRATAIVRKDWLENLGLEMPETTDDLAEVARAFTEDDPDGNGADDTYGLIIPQWPGAIGSNSPYDVIETWFGAGNKWTELGGELVPNFTTDEWFDAVEYEKALVDGGYVNADYATFDSASWNEPFLNGEGGIIIDVHSRAQQLIGLLKESDPEGYDQYVDVSGNLTGPDGELYAHPTDGYSGFLAIPKAQVQTEEQLRQVLEILNDMNSPEVARLMNNGIEGVTYETNDEGLAVAIDDAPTQLKDDVMSFAQLGTNVTGFQGLRPAQPTEYEQEMYDKRLAIEEADTEFAVFNEAAAFVSPTYVSKGAQLDVIVSDARLKYIAGQISREELESEIARWRAEGGDDVIAEINDLAGDQ
ncbi:extracellular solute-binding protein [Microbacterium excoecariae]|uniref:extracellular solute-binding protein n=1 Tax=Microbacterium excoecariae TaxID=2715210 RepID=UPI00140E175C|nr:extracellular solute-binding protein [Microbacterium excoecariae]NHI17341.1 extracellular solute-binding protein [Microbacterium excoecariae]